MKRNANGNGSVRKISVARDGKTYTYWQARYSAGFDPGTGKQKQHSITGKTQKEVLQKLKAATAAIDSGSYIEPSAMTVAQWLQSWSDNYLEGIKPSTAYLSLSPQHRAVSDAKPRCSQAVRAEDAADPGVLQRSAAAGQKECRAALAEDNQEYPWDSAQSTSAGGCEWGYSAESC